MWYVVVFLAALAVDLIPVVAPPAWTIMVLLLVKFHLNPWLVLLCGVPGSTLGRYLLSLYLPKFGDKLVKRQKREDLEFLGKKLSGTLWHSWLFVFLYTLTPLSATALFTAAGMARVNPLHTVPAFFAGKFLSDAVMIYTGHYAAQNWKDMFSVKGMVTLGLGFVVLGAFLFIDWRTLLQKKKFKLNFKIWK